MSRTLQCLAGALAWLAATSAALALQSAPSIDDFARMPQMDLVAISPNGEQIAYSSEAQGTRIIVILNRSTGENRIVRIDQIRAHSLRWANDDTLLFTGSNARRMFRSGGALDFVSAFAINLEDDPVEVLQILQNARGIGRNLNVGTIEAVINDGENVLIPVFDNDGDYTLFEGRTNSESGRPYQRGNHLTNYWVVDGDGRIVARVDRSEQHNEQALYAYHDGRAERILSQTGVTLPTYSVHGLLPDGRLAITARMAGGSNPLSGLYALSLQTGDIEETIFLDDQADLGGVRIDPYTNRVIGWYFEDTFPVTQWLDEDLQQIQDALQGGLRADAVQLLSWSRDRNTLIVSGHWPDRPTVTYVVDWATRQVAPLGASHALPTDGSLPVRQSIEYPARDGTAIPAYLTLPDGDGPHPTIVLPHGGPAARDTGGFDFLAHFLATRGYAVIQPNFRGSSGYGRNWEHAGHGQWGTGVMQHDLTDAVNALVASDISDPDRVCIAGFSYGGYAALAGATYTPDLYACAFGMAGVYDLNEMFRWVQDRYGRNHWSLAYWAAAMSDNADDRRSILAAASPAASADAVSIPIMLMHGANDTVVPIEQSEIMERALRGRQADVEFVRLDEADHWLTDTETRRAVLQAMERFFGEHIGD